MKTARGFYPDTSDELFDKATDFVCENYSYVPWMEPARNGFIEGYKAALRDIGLNAECLICGYNKPNCQCS